jgi:hypothetical protein
MCRSFVVVPVLLLFFCACSGSSSSVPSTGQPSNGSNGTGTGGTTPPTTNGASIVNNGGSVSFGGVNEQITRTSAYKCGAPSPYASSDVYGLNVTASGPPPQPLLAFTVPASTPLGAPQTLTVFPWTPSIDGPAEDDPNGVDTNPESASDQTNSLSISLARGSNASYVDQHAFDSATVTVLGIPQKDGDALIVRLSLQFEDGQTLDQTFTSPPVTTPAVTPCPAGGG